MQSTSYLLACDHHGSVLRSAAHVRSRLAYTPFGFNALGDPMLKFNGQRSEQLGGGYLLGHGYRSYSPAIMRFHSPDSWSPFGDGGLNVYTYCLGEPVNRLDPSGHAAAFKKVVRGSSAVSLDAPPLGGRTQALIALHAIPDSPIPRWRYMLPSLSGTRSIDDVASAYLPAREAAMVVARANEYASRQLGPVVGVKTIKRVSAIEGLSTGDADFANAIFAQNQTPYMRIVEYADAGSPYHRAMAEELLDKIFDTPYRGLPIGERKMISRAVTNHVKRFNYPDRWYRMKDLRRV